MTEFWGPPAEAQDAPRATRLIEAEDGLEIWMGGSQSLLGDPITPAALDRAIVVDCSGELPEAYRARSGDYLPRVFLDIESVPSAYPRLASLVHDLAGRRYPWAPTGVKRIYILCQQGMNRSGLVAGLLLRALGYESADAIGLIRERRPGSLSNSTFVRLVEEWRCPERVPGEPGE